MDSRSLLRPAVWGGLLIAVVSGVPVLNWINCMCCAGVLSGGLLAVYLYRRQIGPHSEILSRTGALLGLSAGIIGAVLGGIIGLLFNALTLDFIAALVESLADPAFRDQFAEWTAVLASPLAYLGLLALSLIINSLFGLLGGLIGVAFWGREKMMEKDA
ncbi:hypothetical protein JW992_02450 [candidate division KSB1 bacterium]|nr:hypothetical protein [candidate division KSB1 bacterium]